MLFAYDLLMCDHSRADVELQLEKWRATCESQGLRVSRGTTARVHAMPRQIPNYLPSGERREDNEYVQASGHILRCQRS